MTPLRALLVDLAPERVELRCLLAAHADVHVAAEADGLAGARDALAATAIDVMFLALTLPGGDALALLRAVPTGTHVIMMTAPERPLLRALHQSPANHLPKPLTAADVTAVLDHVRRAGIRRPPTLLPSP
jgi:two-component system, LytTR family, response regulator